jgi:MFS family permease
LLPVRSPRPLRPLTRALRVSPGARIIGTVFLTLLCYITIGLPLAVIPGFTRHTLGFNAVLAGLAVSLQYLATFASRPFAGRMVDTAGPKRSVIIGLASCVMVGLLLIATGQLALALPEFPAAALLTLLASRLVLGMAESLTATGSITWAIGQVGPTRTAQVISWNGIASYGGIAFGAPLGVVLAGKGAEGFTLLGLLPVLLGSLGLALATRRRPIVPKPGERLPFFAILGRVLPHGSALGLGSVGFGVIAAFIALFFASRSWPANGWASAASALSVFGLMFIAARLVFASAIGRLGGYRVGIASLAVETLGLLILWQSASPAQALCGAALTGAGFALVFPALGVEAVKRVGPENRGSALGAYSVFLDISLGLSGPVLGLIANHAGYAVLFLVAALACLSALALTGCLLRRAAIQ